MKKNRLLKSISKIKSEKRKILVFFLTAGFPDLKTTEKVILSLERGGADIIELGVPFSDPIADGPAIQWSSQKAIRAGVSLVKILRFIRNLKKKTQIPVVLMSYLNPIYKFGIDRFLEVAKKNNLDALLITDIIPEEAKILNKLSGIPDIPVIFLMSTTTSASRYKKIINSTRGFLYVVSLTGVTGERKKISRNIFSFLKKLRRFTVKPIVVGFGISTPKHASQLRGYADGIVIGSALVNLIKKTKKNLLQKKVERFAFSFRRTLDGKK